MASAKAKRFRARIYKQGPNPYVDVPQRISDAFASHAPAGRISVEGKLNSTAILATLVPVGKGGHRLYVNGGMRSATGVGVGDTVSFELRAISRDSVPLPSGMTAASGRVPNAATSSLTGTSTTRASVTPCPSCSPASHLTSGSFSTGSEAWSRSAAP